MKNQNCNSNTNLKNINWQAIEEYFIIFKKEDELKSLRERLKDA